MLAMDAVSRSTPQKGGVPIHSGPVSHQPDARLPAESPLAQHPPYRPFHSIFFERAEHAPAQEMTAQPVFFTDLNLDQVLDSIVASKQEYNLRPFFHVALHDPDAIAYRHEVMRDLDNPAVLQCI